MKTALVQTLTSTFEAHAQRPENGVEFWLARDLQQLLGYTEWRNFLQIVNNLAVRNTLLERGIRPEALPAAEDVKKVERRLTSAEKKSLKKPEALAGEI